MTALNLIMCLAVPCLFAGDGLYLTERRGCMKLEINGQTVYVLESWEKNLVVYLDELYERSSSTFVITSITV